MFRGRRGRTDVTRAEIVLSRPPPLEPCEVEVSLERRVCRCSGRASFDCDGGPSVHIFLRLQAATRKQKQAKSDCCRKGPRTHLALP
jgi:hypothetical protein